MLRGINEGFDPGVDVFSDGFTVVTGDSEGFLRRWDLRTGRVLWVSADHHGDRISDVRVSPKKIFVASTSGDGTIRIWNVEGGDCFRTLRHGSYGRQLSWSPDGNRIAVASWRHTLEVLEISTGEIELICQGHSRNLWGVSWSPDGELLASASSDNTVRIWDAQTGALIHTIQAHSGRVSDVKWSPDGRLLASSSEDATVAIWEASTWHLRLLYRGHQKSLYRVQCLAWSPSGTLVASAGDSIGVRVWEAATGRDLTEFSIEENDTWRLAWSPNGAFLVSSHSRNVFRFWDTRELTRAPQATVVFPAADPSPEDLGTLMEAFAALHCLGLSTSLALLKELLNLTGGDRREGNLADLSAHPGIRALADLRWPGGARVGLVALLLRGVPLEDWKPPGRVSSSEMIEALGRALHGEKGEPDTPQLPIASLQQAAEAIDDRLVTLLMAVGPQAVAADPGLPLRLLPRIAEIPALSAWQRRLLGLRLRSKSTGRSLGYGCKSKHSGVGLRGNLRSLLPSQLVLKEDVLTSKHMRGELLYRTGTEEEALRLRPAVLVLDVSPASFGPVETMTRLAAHVLASSLLLASLPVVLVTAGGRSGVYPLARVSDLVEIWSRRSLDPASAGRALGVARALQDTLREGPLEPVIVVLAHAWFGADEEVAVGAGLRGLFVQYPSYSIRPPLASACERWESVASGEMSDLAERLARVVG